MPYLPPWLQNLWASALHVRTSLLRHCLDTTTFRLRPCGGTVLSEFSQKFGLSASLHTLKITLIRQVGMN